MRPRVSTIKHEGLVQPTTTTPRASMIGGVTMDEKIRQTLRVTMAAPVYSVVEADTFEKELKLPSQESNLYLTGHTAWQEAVRRSADSGKSFLVVKQEVLTMVAVGKI